MTNKEAAEMISNDMKLHHDYLSGEYRKALNMAISALQAQDSPKPTAESAQNVQNEDLILRKAAIDAIADCTVYGDADELEEAVMQGNDWNRWSGGVLEALEAVKELPSAQPEIIRCKDCKHSEFWYRDKRRCFLWHEEGIDVFEDGFCNYVERRTDAV